MLVAHEPVANLDLIAGRRIIDLIAEVAARRGLALVYISDNLRAVAAVCGRVMIVEAGADRRGGKGIVGVRPSARTVYQAADRVGQAGHPHAGAAARGFSAARSARADAAARARRYRAR